MRDLMPTTTLSRLRCACCEQHVPPDARRTGTGGHACDACVSQGCFQLCTGCDSLASNQRRTIDGARCRGCIRRDGYAQCDYCNQLATSLTLTADQESVCHVDARNLARCGECEGLIRSGDYCHGCADSLGDDCGCSDCHEIRNSDLMSYGFTPRPRFHGSGPAYLGLELEMEVDTRCSRYGAAETARDVLNGLGWCKEDGSLSNGFELVCHPMDYQWAIEHFPWDLLRELAEDHGCIAAGSAGLHVHVSRKAFDDPAHVFRWMKFVYRNPDQVQTVARRHGSSWAGFGDHLRKRVKEFAKGDTNAERYSAINVQNTHTFEVRVFASSLNQREVKAALGLVSASVEYTRQLTVPVILAGGWNWSAFVDWLRERPEYAPLLEELEERQCVS